MVWVVLGVVLEQVEAVAKPLLLPVLKKPPPGPPKPPPGPPKPPPGPPKPPGLHKTLSLVNARLFVFRAHFGGFQVFGGVPGEDFDMQNLTFRSKMRKSDS